MTDDTLRHSDAGDHRHAPAHRMDAQVDEPLSFIGCHRRDLTRAAVHDDRVRPSLDLSFDETGESAGVDIANAVERGRQGRYRAAQGSGVHRSPLVDLGRDHWVPPSSNTLMPLATAGRAASLSIQSRVAGDLAKVSPSTASMPLLAACTQG